jgi:hypothetical protein
MAKDNEKRKSRFDDEEDESEQMLSPAKRKLKVGAGESADPQHQLFSGSQAVDSQTLDIKLAEVKALMEQTHQLYQHYFNGIEKRPPIEKARLLESRIAELQRVSLTNATAKFKLSQFVIQYKSYQDLWQRRLRDKER